MKGCCYYGGLYSNPSKQYLWKIYVLISFLFQISVYECFFQFTTQVVSLCERLLADNCEVEFI